MRVNGVQVDHLSITKIVEAVRNCPPAILDRTSKNQILDFPSEEAAQSYDAFRATLDLWYKNKKAPLLEHCLTHLNVILTVSEAANDQAYKAFAYSWMADIYTLQKKPTQALNMAHRALDLLSDTTNINTKLRAIRLGFTNMLSLTDNHPDSPFILPAIETAKIMSREHMRLRGEETASQGQLVHQAEIGFSSTTPIGTYNVNDCICIILRNPKTHRTALAHLDAHTDNSSLEIALEQLMTDGCKLEAKLVGGRHFLQKEDHHTTSFSQQNVERTLNLLTSYDVDIVAANIYEQEAPRIISVDPTNFALSETLLPSQETEAYRNAFSTLRRTKSPLKLAFDLDVTNATFPTFIKAQQQRYCLENFKDQHLNWRFKAVYKHYRSQMQAIAIIGNHASIKDTITEALEQLETAIEVKASQIKQQGLRITEQQIQAAKSELSKLDIYIGSSSKDFNKPLFDFIQNDLFVPNKKRVKCQHTKMHKVQLPSLRDHLKITGKNASFETAQNKALCEWAKFIPQ